jgi:hypothetical protein
VIELQRITQRAAEKRTLIRLRLLDAFPHSTENQAALAP